jgi:hypothetical protein
MINAHSVNESQFEVKLLKAKDVAKLFETTPAKIKAAILNRTLPIGFVSESGEDGRDRTIIIKKRLEAYINAEDLR